MRLRSAASPRLEPVKLYDAAGNPTIARDVGVVMLSQPPGVKLNGKAKLTEPPRGGGNTKLRTRVAMHCPTSGASLIPLVPGVPDTRPESATVNCTSMRPASVGLFCSARL